MSDRISQSKVGHNLLRHLEQSGCPDFTEASALLNGEPVESPIILRHQGKVRWVLFRLGANTYSLESQGVTLMREQTLTQLQVQELCAASEQYKWEIGDQKNFSGRGEVVHGVCDLGTLHAGNFIVQIQEKPPGLAGIMARRKQGQS